MQNVKTEKVVKVGKGKLGKIFEMVINSLPRVDSMSAMNKLIVKSNNQEEIEK